MDERDRLKSYFRMLSVNDPYRGNELVDVLDAYLDAKFKRKWQGLTDKEVVMLAYQSQENECTAIRLAEQALKEKNGG